MPRLPSAEILMPLAWWPEAFPDEFSVQLGVTATTLGEPKGLLEFLPSIGHNNLKKY